VIDDDFYGPFERLDRYLMAADRELISAWPAGDDVSVVPKEEIFRKYNRPDGCVEEEVRSRACPPHCSRPIQEGSVRYLLCDEDGAASDNRWRINPWLVDLASSGIDGYSNPACSRSAKGSTILSANGLPFGEEACVNGVAVTETTG